MLGEAFGQVTLAPWAMVYAVGYPVLWIAGLCLLARRVFHRYVITLRRGPVMGHQPALAAFGRNDLRTTCRDSLMVMIVVAPVIWTSAVRFLTPPVTTMLADRYGFDLVPYYPLILTGFLLLTSIIIAGGLAAFLVLDEVDAGTLTALRVTPVPLSTFFGYRAATVMGVTTVYVIATMSFSGILGPGLVTSLVPSQIRAVGWVVGGRDAAVDYRHGPQQDSGHRRGPGPWHAHRRAALPGLVHLFGLEPRLRFAAALLGGEGVLGRQRPRHLVAVPARRRPLQPDRRVAAVPALPCQEHLSSKGNIQKLFAQRHCRRRTPCDCQSPFRKSVRMVRKGLHRLRIRLRHVNSLMAFSMTGSPALPTRECSLMAREVSLLTHRGSRSIG